MLKESFSSDFDPGGPFEKRRDRTPLRAAENTPAKDLIENPPLDLEELADLINNVRNLTDMQKEILIERFVEGKALKEIAQLHNFGTHQDVDMHITRAFNKLRLNPKLKDLWRKYGGNE